MGVPMTDNVLNFKQRSEFRDWLSENHGTASECWLHVVRGRPADPDILYYVDAVEEALCFGWIDSSQCVIDGVRYQRFSPRRKGSPWSELNKERVRRLERLGLMTDPGKAVLPAMGPRSFRIDDDLESALKKARVWAKFRSFHPLYQRVRAYNTSYYKTIDPEAYERALTHLIEETKKGKMYGEWNDYGRLMETGSDGLP